MKKILLLTCILLLTGCIKKETFKNNNLLEVEFKDKCYNDINQYYHNGREKLFLQCINNINIKEDNVKIDLKDYIENNYDSLDEFIEQIINKSDLKNIFGADNNQVYQNNDMQIIKCNTLNKYYYIGNKELYQNSENLCFNTSDKIHKKAIIDNVFDNYIEVHTIDDKTEEKYIITDKQTFDIQVEKKLRKGSIIKFSSFGNVNLSDPPQINVTEIKILE